MSRLAAIVAVTLLLRLVRPPIPLPISVSWSVSDVSDIIVSYLPAWVCPFPFFNSLKALLRFLDTLEVKVSLKVGL